MVHSSWSFPSKAKRWGCLLAQIYLTFSTLHDRERRAPLKLLRNISCDTPDQSSHSHRGHSENVLPWQTDGNQKKSISNDRLLLSTQLILLVIAVDWIEWVPPQTLRDKCVRTHTAHPSNARKSWWIRSADPHFHSLLSFWGKQQFERQFFGRWGEPGNLLNPFAFSPSWTRLQEQFSFVLKMWKKDILVFMITQ